MDSIMTVNKIGDKEWKNENGELHREDGPAIIYPNGYKEWFLNGKRHRENGPAIVYSDRYKAWYLNDKHYTEKEWKQEIRKIKLSTLKF